MGNFLFMLLAILLGSAISLLGGASIFLIKKRRVNAIDLALPFGAGALLSAAFFDLLPESFEAGNPSVLLKWVLVGFLVFFVLERLSGWFHRHHHHQHDDISRRDLKNNLVMFGDFVHNVIDGIAIGTAFLANPISGLITVIAVSAHEIPKELGTFGILLARGWRDGKVILANIATAIGTILSATLVYVFGSLITLPKPELLALTSGFFIYIAASDIIPEIHNQPWRKGLMQSAVLIGGVVSIAGIILALH